MSTPDSNQNEPNPSKMKKILNSEQDQSIMSRLPRRTAGQAAAVQPKPSEMALVPVPTPEPAAEPPSETKRAAEEEKTGWRSRFWPVFWTIASTITFVVNIVLIIVVVVLLMNRQPVGAYADTQVTQLLGGLYDNFVLMDEANIRTNIHVEQEIPVQFSLSVSGPTDVTLREPVTIDGALVTVATGGLNIVNARARIILPEGTVLPVNIQNLVVPVDQKVLAVLDVPVDIPLNQTELHEPFVGLQQVVKPWYCLMKSDELPNVCADTPNPLEPVFNIFTP